MMIKALRRKFILSAMLSLTLLVTLLIGGIVAFTYLRNERMVNDILQAIAQGDNPEPPDHAGDFPPRGDYIGSDPFPWGYFIADAAQDTGNIAIQSFAGRSADIEALESIARLILSSGQDSGTVGAYKYLKISRNEKTRVVCLNNTQMKSMMRSLLISAGTLSALGLALMFLILLPVSGRAVRPYVVNMEKQKQFVTNASHEIKTPIAVISSNLDAMELIQGENKWSKNIKIHLERLNALLDHMLLLARSDEANHHLLFDPLDICRILREEIPAYTEMLRQKNLSLKTHMEKTCVLTGNEDSLRQCVRILLDNAVRYANSGGEIDISLCAKQRRIFLTFFNTVDELPHSEPETLFERFHRDDQARAKRIGGSGVGLSAARAVMEMHHGSIHAAYEKAGVRFTLEFPR